MTRVFAALAVDPEKKRELVAAALPAIEETRREEGCLAYDLFNAM